MRKCLLLLVLCFVAQTAAVHSQPFRFLPAAGERGRTGESLPLPVVKIGRRVLELAPGALIFDQNNRTLVHAQLPVNAEVLYTRDQAGQVQRVYILTEEEKARLAAAGKR
ncbi:MAG: hypothetical protein JWO70_1537 [Betaproteobacteria bacterium]|jgi:hypothetical protein|nr:hypothetical protein [Betaproteobacteria bacterium]